MPLSEHEQRLLDEMERNLYQNDADFVAAVGKGRGGTNYRALVLGILLGILGLAVLVAGVVVRQPLVGILGFAFMLGGVIVAMRPAAGGSAEPGLPDVGRPSKPRSGNRQGSGFMDRLNDRWDNRGDGRG
ncbi:hypothetical protein C5C36_09195 [Rathayibacter sp. AY1G1]|jgi:hypothetical protein|uniref:DUF3040 domain-containing protein n=1 Tax=unclassified Rathayibacter TaxID=2609250 RepID=UPI000CE8B61F|nr:MULTISPECIES: DUF3040 domain-containing protein [unclassified Rathayibacter]PPF11829.1 hypothetical protein C5B98_06740 [Rathayibacter sp. AY1A5]PPF19330.1 hypothetical protein C5B95_10405 [Rathayibacter sp. AY1A7]PPF50205.1 hypothetical protein C5E14_02665 [Rathayibacter sp. AY1A1]PPF74328.1 hypothetical protein C5C46_01350 [Rathayibacter sp. AY1E6]PPG07279.1 hypothetical protein C5C26_10140 [Rathayibacter sp. AY2B1]